MKIEELLNELDEEKLLVWHDEDMFEVGYNEAIDVAKQLIEYRVPEMLEDSYHKGYSDGYNEKTIETEEERL